MGILDSRILRDFDWLLFLLPIGLVGFGTVFIYSAQPDQNYWFKQLVFLGIGVVLCLVTAFVDYRKWLQFAPAFYVAMLLALVAVLIVGEKINGQRAWINLRVTNFQPSEFAKFATMLMVARFLTADKGRRGPLPLKDILIAGGIVAVPVALILMQPDTGTVLTYFPVLLTMLFLSGLQVRWLAMALVGGLLAVSLAWGFVLKDYQKQRIEMAWTLASGSTQQLTTDQKRGNGYQSLQSIIAVGSGGLTGKGIGQGTQGRLGFLPERHTDFIASILSEETGFFGAATMLLLYSLLVWRLVSVARLARERFGALVVMGLATLFIFHIFVNLGMVVGLMPIMGIPLPFLSYGGSSLLMVFAGIGFALSLRLRRFVN
jgi:rod shape determining protein RodA